MISIVVPCIADELFPDSDASLIEKIDIAWSADILADLIETQLTKIYGSSTVHVRVGREWKVYNGFHDYEPIGGIINDIIDGYEWIVYKMGTQ